MYVHVQVQHRLSPVLIVRSALQLAPVRTATQLGSVSAWPVPILTRRRSSVLEVSLNRTCELF
jgi:hypothetical protein